MRAGAPATRWTMRSSPVYLSVVVIAAAAVVAGFRFYDGRRVPALPSQGGDPSRLDALEKEVAALRAERGALRPAASLPPALSTASSGPMNSSRDAEPPASPVSSVPRKSSTEIRDDNETRFYSEPSDPDWGKSTAAQLQDQLSSIAPAGSTIREVDCRSTLCRVEASHPNAQSYQDFVQSTYFGASFSWEGPMMITVLHKQDDGEIESVAYLARKGAPAPFPARSSSSPSP